MQSTEELKRVASFLGVIRDKHLNDSIRRLKEAFSVRNHIAHDMDIKITKGYSRNRRPRKREDMILHTNQLLEAAESLVKAVDSTLK